MKTTFAFAAAIAVSSSNVAAQTTTQTGGAPCTSMVASVAGNVTINMVCGLTKDELKANAERSLGTAADELGLVVQSNFSKQSTNRRYFLSALRDYAATPTRPLWFAVQDHARRSEKYLEAAIDAAIAYDASLRGKTSPILDRLHKSMYERKKLFASLRDEPLTPADAKAWATEYEQLLQVTGEQIEALQEEIRTARP